MRRQVRPFVTEYRASGRRGKDASSPSSRTDRDSPRDGEAPRELFASPFNASPFNASGDDSYEAALKAADALFTFQRSAGGDPDAVKPMTRTPQPARPLTAAEAVFSPPAPVSDRGSEASEPSGRILRAIEEPNADPYSALEAERAPKRRGRKPGSKNKPKVPALMTTAALAAIAMPVAPEVWAFQAPVEIGPTASMALAPETNDADLAAPVVVRTQALAPLDSTPRDRFAWVRTKLRPGEKWKRRLPKVAW